MLTKCRSCNKEKEYFANGMCKQCYKKWYYLKNKEKILKRIKEYSKTLRGKEINRKATEKYRASLNGKKTRKEHYQKNKEQILKKQKEFRKKK